MKYLGINVGNVLFALKGTNVWQRHIGMNDPQVYPNPVNNPACNCCIPYAIQTNLEAQGIDFSRNDGTNPPTEKDWQDVLRQHKEAPRVFFLQQWALSSDGVLMTPV